MQLSDVQVLIMTKFITNPELTYSEAAPEGVSNDLYKYHLKFLLSKAYIEKVGNKYRVTDEGKKLGNFISPTGVLRESFYVCIMPILLTEYNGELSVLIQKRGKHPNFGEISTISGKILKGEKLLESARRKLKEETQLNAVFSYVGMLRAIRYDNDNSLLMDQWFNVCIANAFTGNLEKKTPYGDNFFCPVSKLVEYNDSRPIENLLRILNLVEEKQTPFYLEDITTKPL